MYLDADHVDTELHNGADNEEDHVLHRLLCAPVVGKVGCCQVQDREDGRKSVPEPISCVTLVVEQSYQ
jgi:hypothetical protein